MQNLVRLAIVLVLAAGVPLPAHADATAVRAIDPTRSKAQFAIQHVFVDRVTGTVAIREGTVTLGATGLMPVAVSATLDAASITTDEPDRDRALESADYFDSTAFPTWTFTSTRIAASSPGHFTMDGTLTMHGVAQPEHFEVAASGTTDHPIYHATARIDRHAFGMKGGRLDPVIGNEADITLDITLR